MFDDIAGFIDEIINDVLDWVFEGFLNEIFLYFGNTLFSIIPDAFNVFLSSIESIANKIAFGYATIDLSKCKIESSNQPELHVPLLKIGIDAIDDGVIGTLFKNVENLLVDIVGHEILNNGGEPLVDRRITIKSDALASILFDIHDITEHLRVDCHNKDEYIGNLVEIRDKIKNRMSNLTAGIEVSDEESGGCEAIIDLTIPNKDKNADSLKKYLENLLKKLRDITPGIPTITIPDTQCSTGTQIPLIKLERSAQVGAIANGYINTLRNIVGG